ncbi:hypothetical protein SAMN05216238_103208 [Lentibacillus persicus]|uniref:Uncharacterized protein n=1 Tax=Lentibacillus persicus TaxID=640948 RepID=A0A1I1UGJ8_9BACI|nr:hypothetical protein [Lentibacillus persicus]SFD69976.1 hypothetical protein SAMN05216238_103208 [Lentibacillus persicus]
MGLFINQHEHPYVFKNSGKILEPNQGYFHKDNFQEMLNDQKAINQKLADAFQEVKQLHHRQQQVNAGKWKHVSDELRAIRKREEKHDVFEDEVMKQLAKLARNGTQLQQLVEKEDIMKKDVADRVESLNESSMEIMEQLRTYDAANTKLIDEMNALAERNKEMAEQIDKQDQAQKNTLERLENQEALMEKVHRQISEFRAILFERSSYIAEKIEDSYNLTSSYVYKLMKSSDQPLTWYVDQKKAGNEKRD